MGGNGDVPSVAPRLRQTKAKRVRDIGSVAKAAAKDNPVPWRFLTESKNGVRVRWSDSIDAVPHVLRTPQPPDINLPQAGVPGPVRASSAYQRMHKRHQDDVLRILENNSRAHEILTSARNLQGCLNRRVVPPMQKHTKPKLVPADTPDSVPAPPEPPEDSASHDASSVDTPFLSVSPAGSARLQPQTQELRSLSSTASLPHSPNLNKTQSMSTVVSSLKDSSSSRSLRSASSKKRKPKSVPYVDRFGAELNCVVHGFHNFYSGPQDQLVDHEEDQSLADLPLYGDLHPLCDVAMATDVPDCLRHLSTMLVYPDGVEIVEVQIAPTAAPPSAVLLAPRRRRRRAAPKRTAEPRVRAKRKAALPNFAHPGPQSRDEDSAGKEESASSGLGLSSESDRDAGDDDSVIYTPGHGEAEAGGVFLEEPEPTDTALSLGDGAGGEGGGTAAAQQRQKDQEFLHELKRKQAVAIGQLKQRGWL